MLMSIDNRGIPTRKKSNGQSEVETRPIYVEEWLDSLPYVDFDKTSELLNTAMRESNRVKMKPMQRIELISQYNRPYQYYIDSQIEVGARHTLHSIETLQSQIYSLKQLSVAMAMASRVAVEEALKQKTLWKQTKPPLDAVLMSMNYLSHTLIFSYLEYSPVPKNIWREINFLYDFVRGINQEKTLINEINDGKKKGRSSVDAVYKRIILASMVDPHHLPFGAIWEIYTQLDSWVEFTEVAEYRELENATGYFVMDVKNDVRPVPYSKFNKQLVKGRTLRILNASKLVSLVQSQLTLLKAKKSLSDNVIFSKHHAKTVLSQMASDWGLPPKRVHTREARTGELNLAIGINSSYYFLNEKKDFVEQIPQESDEIGDLIDVSNGEHNYHYAIENWQLVDNSDGGYAVIRSGKPGKLMRVGDLVLFKLGIGGSYSLGIIRWLMVRPNNVYKTGIQMIADKAIAVSVRMPGENNSYHRGFLSGDLAKDNASLITGQGLYSPNQTLEITKDDKTFNIEISDLKESTLILEQFGVTLH